MMRRFTLSLLAAGFLVACNRTPTAPTGVPLVASQGEHGSAPSLSWSPVTPPSSDTYDFGTLDPGASETATVTFTLTNTGGRSSGTISSVSLSTSTGYSITVDNCTGSSLGPNKSCTVSVEFAPSGSGTFTDELTATAEHGSASLDLTGVGGSWTLEIVPYTIKVPQSGGWTDYSYEMGFVAAGATFSQTFAVTNVGNGTSPALVVDCDATNSATCPSSDWGSISNDNCTGSTLAPNGNGTCTFDLDVTVPSPCGDAFYITQVHVGDHYFVDAGSLLLNAVTRCSTSG